MAKAAGIVVQEEVGRPYRSVAELLWPAATSRSLCAAPLYNLSPRILR